jgi:hypothetical protein
MAVLVFTALGSDDRATKALAFQALGWRWRSCSPCSSHGARPQARDRLAAT